VPEARAPGRRALGAPALLAAGVAYSWALAGTTPFTRGADVLTAIPLALVVGALVVQSTPMRVPALLERVPAPQRRPIRPSLVVVGIVLGSIVGFELFNLFAGSRLAHPTLSSMETTATQWHGTRTVAVLVWLWLGTYLVRR
jgi:hypothetical protein